MEMQSPIFFKSASDLHKWFEKNHDQVSEAWIGFYHVKSGKKGITYKEAVDEALCFGWIDGIRKGIDGSSYVNRFTPRRKSSNWSNVNIKRMQELITEGRVKPPGLAAFSAREEKQSGVYSFEQAHHKLAAPYAKQFRANKKAWVYFTSRAPWYQRTSIHWVMNARRQATQLKRLQTLITDSENQRTLAQLTPNPKK